MRGIKFRAWDKKYNEMLYDDFILFNGMIYREPRDFEDGRNTNALEIMQFTGLLDKRGIEIYEGDILMWGSEDGTIKTCNGYGVVEYWDGDGCYEIKDIKGVTNGISCTSYNEVIGNIYENPELLEQQ